MDKKSVTCIVLLAAVLLSATVIEDGSGIDLLNLFDYVNVDEEESATLLWNFLNPITDEGATLGRVLFYDKQLSVNNSVACASCHQQENAFGDTRVLSEGFNDELTKRHSMRLTQVDFSSVVGRFWDARTLRLENLTTEPIQDPIEMGFSGANGFPGIDSLTRRLSRIDYYAPLFEKAFGDSHITEKRIGNALAQFIRSIVAFDSKFDEGHTGPSSSVFDYPNFTDQENRGKMRYFGQANLDTTNSFRGGNCFTCHGTPSFSMLNQNGNNGVIGVAGDSSLIDLSIIRAPSLRNIFRPDGTEIGPFMHDGSLKTLRDVIEHYNHVPFNPDNTNLAPNMRADANGEVRLHLSSSDIDDLIAFLKTISSEKIYTEEKWSDPFSATGELCIRTCETKSANLDITICEGDSYEGKELAGVYKDTFQLSVGCDSILTTNLFVLPIDTTRFTVELCDNVTTDTTGVYLETEINSNGCDSIIITDLIVSESANTFESATICEGESFKGFSESGTYDIIGFTTYGCDSIHTIELEVLPENDPACSTSSTTMVNSKDEIIISPNPSSRFFTISNLNSSAHQLTIVDPSGKVLRHQETYGSDRVELECIDINKGTYILIVHDHKLRLLEARKIIKL